MGIENYITFAAAILAFMASLIATTYTRRYFKEKWWDRKFDAYQEIISALAQVRNYYDYLEDVLIEGVKVSEKKQKHLEDDLLKGFDRVQKAAHIGAFLISTKSEDILKEFLREPDNVHPGDVDGLMLAKGAKSIQAIEQLRLEAKKDLKTRGW